MQIVKLWLLIFFLLPLMFGCSSVSVMQPEDKALSLDKELLKNSDSIDFVYTDGVFSSMRYLKRENTNNLKVEDYKKPLCVHSGQKPVFYSTAVWIWKYKRVIGHEKEVIERLIQSDIKRVYIQIGGDLEVFKIFMRLARENGIIVFALDGSPEYIDDFGVLLADLKRIRKFNEEHRDGRFAGLQIDVEPYLKKDFNIRKDYYIKRYIKMAQDLRKEAGNQLSLSFVLPFWFDKLLSEDKPLSFWITDISDEIAIMSYRTEYMDIIDSASDELCYAANAGKAVFLGLEITRLPEEQHFIADKKDIVRLLGTIGKKLALPDKLLVSFPWVRKYEVRSDKITFYKNKDKLPGIMTNIPPFPSFAGYIIHSFEELYK